MDIVVAQLYVVFVRQIGWREFPACGETGPTTKGKGPESCTARRDGKEARSADEPRGFLDGGGGLMET